MPSSPPAPRAVHIVEDDDAVRDALCLLLRAEGYTVSAWNCGERFLAEAALGAHDILVLDLALPGCDGVGVMKALSARGDCPPVVVVSGLRGRAFDRAVAAMRPAAALRKPLDGAGLTSTVRAVAATT